MIILAQGYDAGGHLLWCLLQWGAEVFPQGADGAPGFISIDWNISPSKFSMKGEDNRCGADFVCSEDVNRKKTGDVVYFDHMGAFVRWLFWVKMYVMPLFDGVPLSVPELPSVTASTWDTCCTGSLESIRDFCLRRKWSWRNLWQWCRWWQWWCWQWCSEDRLSAGWYCASYNILNVNI